VCPVELVLWFACIDCVHITTGTAHIHTNTLAFYRALDLRVLSVYTKASLSGVCTFDEDEVCIVVVVFIVYTHMLYRHHFYHDKDDRYRVYSCASTTPTTRY
jgi:hypothetical protein